MLSQYVGEEPCCLIVFVAPTYFLCWGPWSWTQHSRWGLRIVEGQSSLWTWLPLLFLWSPTWNSFSGWQIHTIGSCPTFPPLESLTPSIEGFSQWWLLPCLGLHRPSTLNLDFLNLIKFPQVHFSRLSKSSWMESFPCVKCTAQLPVIYRHGEGALDLTVSLIKKLKSNSPKTDLRNTTHYRPTPGHRAIDHSSVAVQPIPCPLNNLPFKLMCLHFQGKDAMRSCVKGFKET